MVQHGGGKGKGRRLWTDKVIRRDVPPGRKALAVALQVLARHLKKDPKEGGKPPTQKEAANRLITSESSLSRFLQGRYVPDLSVVNALYAAACADAGSPDRVGVTRGELNEVHARAEAERRCRRCASLSKDTELARAEADALRRQLKEAKNTKAGLQARLITLSRPTPLPVPRRRRDRQRMTRDTGAARQVAQRVRDLQNLGAHGEELALTLLRQTTTEVLSPVETAFTLASLRAEEQHQLADNLIHIYGRDQPDQDVMNIALALHELGLAADAGAILRSAVG
ncbi:hypothetical protein [Streptomyces sp. NPDC005374]|uniref:hypothetical protein n=1 Tax=Streptomyces sp. NPDC005374 TaxID=3364713 RepID=UPI0036ADAAA3